MNWFRFKKLPEIRVVYGILVILLGLIALAVAALGPTYSILSITAGTAVLVCTMFLTWFKLKTFYRDRENTFSGIPDETELHQLHDMENVASQLNTIDREERFLQEKMLYRPVFVFPVSATSERESGPQIQGPPPIYTLSMP